MTHIANAINRLMLKQPGMTAKWISARTGIDQSYISMLRSGKRDYISKENLASLALAIGRNTEERAEIIAAHLKDESCGFYPDLIQIKIGGKNPSLNTEIDPDIEYLQSHLSDQSVRQAVRALAGIKRAQKLARNSAPSPIVANKQKASRSQ